MNKRGYVNSEITDLLPDYFIVADYLSRLPLIYTLRSI